jgi:tetratricopeptide (TPR) repeat protein
MATQGATDAQSAKVAEIARLADQDRPEATKLAADARARGVRAPIIHYLIGVQLQDARRFDAAIVEFGLGLALAPNDARLISSVGLCLMRLGRTQEALKVFAGALNADPTSADASFGYGWAATTLGDAGAAESAFQRAIDLNPVHADALAGLAGLALGRGDWTRARVMAMNSIEARPGNLDAVMTLARLDIDQEVFDTAEERLNTILDAPELDPMARADALILFGDALDGQKRYSEAFDRYTAGKSERAKAVGRGHGASATETVRKIETSFSRVQSNWVKSAARSDQAAEKGPLIVTGFPHAGVEAIGSLLSLFPGVSVLDQTPLWTKADNAFLDPPDGMSRLARAQEGDLDAYRTDYWARAGQFGASESLLADVQPLATVRLPILAKLFPSATLILVMRDPRDVVWDCFRHDRTDGPVGRAFDTLAGAAEFFDAAMTATETYFNALGVVPIRVAGDDLESDLAGILQRLSEVLALPEPPIAVSQAIAALDRGPRRTEAGHWRNYADALESVRSSLDSWIGKFGYEPW